MKFKEIFRFEIDYQLKHFSTWLLFGAFFLFGFMILRMVTLPDGTYLNAPGTIAFFTIFGSVIWLVLGGVVAGDAATRDVHTRMHPLIYTAPVSKFGYLGARFLAALTINILILLLLYTGFLISLYGPGAKPEFVGPFRAASYLTSFTFISLPTAIVATAIQFSLAALSGRAIAGYVASVLIIIFSQFGGTMVMYGLEWKTIGSMMDLLGTSIAANMEGWTPIEKNTRLVLLEGMWLWNRVAWVIISGVALSITYFRFRLEHVSPERGWPKFFGGKRIGTNKGSHHSLGALDRVKEGGSAIIVPRVVRDFRLLTFARQVVAIARTSFATIAKSWGGLTLVGILAIGTGLFATEYMQWLNVPLIARTEEVIRILAPALSSFKTQWVIIPLLTIFYAGELVWREREAGLNELFDTAPTPEWVMLSGKFTGLALLITAWMAFLLTGGMINQVMMGYHNFEISVYLKVLFGIQLTNYLLFALLVFVIHVVVNQKYIAHMVAFCAYGFILFSSMLGIEHNMFIYASDPGWSYSDMRGFGSSLIAWVWFKLYWVSWACFLAVAATLLWVRSRERGLKIRLHLAHDRFKRQRVAVFLALGLVTASGSYVFLNTNVLNKYVSKDDRMNMRAEYERRYGRYERIARPALTRTSLNVEIYPRQQSANIKGTYHLMNRGETPIKSIHLTTLPHADISELSFSRPAVTKVLDEDQGYRIYQLNQPLRPGDSLRMNFRVHIRSHGFSNEGSDESVAGNGSHITSDWMPLIGFEENRILHDARDREKYRLPPRAARPSLENVDARYNARHAETMDFDAVIGTSGDQIAVAPGSLRRKWTKGDRSYYQYATSAPIQNGYALFSARYAVREALWRPDSSYSIESSSIAGKARPVTIQIYYHPTHHDNIERMVKSVQASLYYYSKEFGPYPYSHFRVLERPGPGRGMHAEAMTIDYQEGYSLMKPTSGGLDLPYHIMAHEVAHQWWGFQLVPAAVEGAGLLVESLATYSAMQVVEENLGYEHLLQYLSQMRQEYEVPRSRAAPPLLKSNNAFMNYRKGPFALFALRTYIGKDRVNNALRKMLHSFTANPPLPTTLDLYRELKVVTPDSLQYLLHDLFAANTFWELETSDASIKQLSAGKWEVTLDVNARKVVVDLAGRETELSMNDLVQIGVFAPAVNGAKQRKPLYMEMHRIKPGKQTIKVNVAGKPARAGIDPNHLLIDLEMEDNIRRVL